MLTVALDNLKGLFQTKLFYDSVNLPLALLPEEKPVTGVMVNQKSGLAYLFSLSGQAVTNKYKFSLMN